MVSEGVRECPPFSPPAGRASLGRAAGIVLLAAACLSIASPASAQAGSLADSAVVGELRRLEAQFGGHLGVCAKNLATGDVVSYNASERFPTASVIKLPVMAAFFHLVEKKQVDPSTKVILTKEDKKPGLLEFMSDGVSMTLLDAVKLMIVLSENTATNLVLDRLAATHEDRLKVVNDFLVSRGLRDTRLLNRLYSWQTKVRTPEAIRYGIGVSTPSDMVLLLEQIHRKTLLDSASCTLMTGILKRQEYNDMIPRYLPAQECESLVVAHKTGSINESKVDVGIVSSDRATYAVAIFVDKSGDRADDLENNGVKLAASASRAIWNHFTGMTGYAVRTVAARAVDWNRFPGGRWCIYRTPFAPFPHGERLNGFTTKSGPSYPFTPHYSDSSIVVFVPEAFTETAGGTNLIVHFHGHMNDNLGVLEQYLMPQAMIDQGINALLVLPQGPYRARDSFGGKMEEPGGFKRLVEDVLETMRNEGVLTSTKVGNVIVSAHSGGYRPAAFSLEEGELTDHVTHLFLFDAFYGQHQFFRTWLDKTRGMLFAAYTDHLKSEHRSFEAATTGDAKSRLRFTPTAVDHEQVVQQFFAPWLSTLGSNWKTNHK